MRPGSSRNGSTHSCSIAAATACSHPAGQLLAQESTRLALDVSRLSQRVRQVASGWEDRLWIVTDEIIEFESLLPVIAAFDALESSCVR